MVYEIFNNSHYFQDDPRSLKSFLIHTVAVVVSGNMASVNRTLPPIQMVVIILIDRHKQVSQLL